MSLVHAILGFLDRQPMTGYDLKTRCFDESVSYFWPADQAQIYRTLDKMESEGWLESELEVQNDRPNRKRYYITTNGQAELRRWLDAIHPLPVHREPFLVQLFFSDRLNNQSIVHRLEQQKAAHEKQLSEYRSIETLIADGSEHSLKREHALAYATLRLGILTEEAYIRWIEDTIQMVNQLPDAYV